MIIHVPGNCIPDSLKGIVQFPETPGLDNALKGIRNPIPRNMDNPHKEIRELVQNGIRG